VTSSRRIEELRRTDVAFRVICACDALDHVTVARFRARLGGAAAAFLTQVLALRARLDMGRLELVTHFAFSRSSQNTTNKDESHASYHQRFLNTPWTVVSTGDADQVFPRCDEWQLTVASWLPVPMGTGDRSTRWGVGPRRGRG